MTLPSGSDGTGAVGLPPALQRKLEAALALHQRGALAEAQAIYLDLLKDRPDHSDALHLYGVSLYQTGNLERAAEFIGRALRHNPHDAAALNNLGNVLSDLKRFEAALSCFDEAIRHKPDYAEALANRGVALQETGRTDEALASFEAAIRLAPANADYHVHRGNALALLKRFDAAIEAFSRALALRADYAEALSNRGSAFAELHRYGQALADLDAAIGLRPEDAQAHFHRANVLSEMERLEEALSALDKAIALKPDHADALCNRAVVLSALKQPEAALESYRRALALKPLDFTAGDAVQNALMIAEWEGLATASQALETGISARQKIVSPFALLAISDDPHLQKACAEIYAQARFPAVESPALPARRPAGKIRLGYFSADFHNHATMSLMAQLFEVHARNDFELHGFSFGPRQEDAMRQRARAAFDSFTEVNDLPDGEVAALSRGMGIDIAIDLKGFTKDCRTGIFAARAAPVQVNYLGYPGTMGASYMDYIIADRILIPPQSFTHYSEKVVWLAHSYQVNDNGRRISERLFTRAELGLPQDGFVFCCFNNNWKITPDVFRIWMRLLAAIPGSVLWLLEDNPSASRNLRKHAAELGVDSARLVFAPRMKLDEHLARHRLADLFLDTLPYNAHTTASDALWAGLPVLTRLGQSFAARVAGSLVSASGLAELVVGSAAEYEAKALGLARDRGKLAAIRSQLAANRAASPLFDARLFARHIEAAFREMVRRSDAGLAPAPIAVGADGKAHSE